MGFTVVVVKELQHEHTSRLLAACSILPDAVWDSFAHALFYYTSNRVKGLVRDTIFYSLSTHPLLQHCYGYNDACIELIGFLLLDISVILKNSKISLFYISYKIFTNKY